MSYPEWQFEIRCLRNDPEVSSSQLVQAIRRSLRGTARKMLIPLGEKATVDDILTKLDALFADISTNGMIMQEFFNSFQRPNENVTTFGCRLESVLQTAIENGHLCREAKNDLLRHKFWSSLSCDRLKSQTRHKYDTITNYDELLREIRQVEKEITLNQTTKLESSGSSYSGKQGGNGKKVCQQAITTDGDRVDSLEKRFDKRFHDLENRMTSRIESKFNAILEKLDDKQQKTESGGSYGQGGSYDRGGSYGQGSSSGGVQRGAYGGRRGPRGSFSRGRGDRRRFGNDPKA